MIANRIFEPSSPGARLDAAVLAAFPTTTRAFVREAVENGGILVDGRKAKKGMKLSGREKIEIAELPEESDLHPLAVPGGSVPEVFADEFLLAYDKPAGMPVQPLSRTETGTLMNQVVADHPECAFAGDDPLMAGALHRIDAGTSGLVLVARTKEVFAAVRDQFAAKSVTKTYLALVEGLVEEGGVLEDDLVHDPRQKQCKMLSMKDRIVVSMPHRAWRPLHAVTRFRPVSHARRECEDLTLLEVTIETGVTHQIRAQLAAAGMHIVNDRLYGAFAVEGMAGHRLHALAAELNHPATGERIKIATPPPSWAGPGEGNPGFEKFDIDF